MSYNMNDWDDTMRSKSTETLGIKKSRKESDDSRSDTGFPRTRTYLVVSLVLIAMLVIACVVLSIFLAKEVKKKQQQTVKGRPPPSGITQKEYCYTAECLRIAADFTRNLNRSVNPCDNFYQYSCGSWIKDHPIPPSRTMYDAFIVLDEQNFLKLRDLLDEDDNLPSKHAVKRAKRYFKDCINEEQVENTAQESIEQFMAKYGSWALNNQTWNSTNWKWSNVLLAMTLDLEETPLFGTYRDINPKESSRHILRVSKLLCSR